MESQQKKTEKKEKLIKKKKPEIIAKDKQISKKKSIENKEIKTKEKKEEIKNNIFFDPYKILKYPLSTEKIVRLVESENKLLFVVDRKAKKSDIKRSIEDLFKVKVKKVNVHITPKGQKRAYIRLSPENSALDVMTQLGLM